MGAPVVHVEVLGRDGEALQRFYAALFGWATSAVPGDYWQVDPGAQAPLRGGIGTARGGSPGGVSFYVQVPDLEQTLTRAHSLGGRTLMPPTRVGDADLAVLADPEGHPVGLMRG